MTPFVEYFKTAAEISDPKQYKRMLLGLPDDPREICRRIQGLLIHPDWIENYGATIDAGRVNVEQQARSVVEILDHICTLQNSPLDQTRTPAKRAIGSSRNFALLLCSVLRSKGVPSRLRSGFATYFEPGFFDQHCICEYWSDTENYWVRIDPQLDDLQVQTLGITFDACDIPIDDYLYAGEGWIMCRRGRAEQSIFGSKRSNGLGFIKGSIVRDILALNKIETLPWDAGWGIVDGNDLQEVDRGELGYIDRLARCSANSLVHLAHSFFKDDEKIRFPPDWNLSMAPTITQLKT